MTPRTKQLLQKAEKAIHAAEILLQAESAEFAIGRAYYALFYVAEALLNEKDLRFKKHTAVHAAYGQHFAHTNLLDPKFHHWLIDAFEERIEGDYGVAVSFLDSDASEMIAQAKEFFAAAQKFLSKS